MASEYKLSGAIGRLPLLGPLLAIPACFVLSLVYSYIEVYNPLIYFTAVAWVIEMGALVAGLSLICKLSICRNRMAMLALGLFVGLITVYFNWAVFIHAFFGMLDGIESPGLVAVVLNPDIIVALAGQIMDAGWYEIFGTSPSGVFLLGIWLIEGVGLVGAGVLGGHIATHEEVFCESCGLWAEKLDLNIRLAVPEDAAVLAQALEGEVDVLLDVPRSEPGASPFLGLNLQACPRCTETATLDFDMVELKYDDDGKLKRDATDLSRVFAISATQLHAFEELAKPPEPEAEAESHEGSEPA